MLKTELLTQLDALLDDGGYLEKSFYMDGGMYFSKAPDSHHRAFETSTRAAIARIAGPASEFYKVLPEPKLRRDDGSRTAAYVGALVAIRNAVDQGLLESLESRLRANVHDDFLDQSETLLAAGYHVAAMVLIGGVLEDHLKKVCNARSLTWKGKGSIAAYNDSLKDVAYPQPTWRRIQAIGDVRNDAAHGDVGKVNRSDVDDSLPFIRRVLAEYPA